MPARPKWPSRSSLAAATGSKPTPSSLMRRCTEPFSASSETVTRDAPECLPTLLSVSWVTRYRTVSRSGASRLCRPVEMAQATPLVASKARTWLCRATSRPCSSSTAGRSSAMRRRSPVIPGRQLVLELGQQPLGLLDLAALDAVAGPGEPVAQRRQLLHGAVMEVGGQPDPLLLGRPQDRLHGPLALGLGGHLAGQAAHAGQGEQEQHHRTAGDHPPTSIGSSRTAWMTSMAGAIREAPVSRASRVLVRRALTGAGSDSDTIDGCRAASPRAM